MNVGGKIIGGKDACAYSARMNTVCRMELQFRIMHSIYFQARSSDKLGIPRIRRIVKKKCYGLFPNADPAHRVEVFSDNNVTMHNRTVKQRGKRQRGFCKRCAGGGVLNRVTMRTWLGKVTPRIERVKVGCNTYVIIQRTATLYVRPRGRHLFLASVMSSNTRCST